MEYWRIENAKQAFCIFHSPLINNRFSYFPSNNRITNQRTIAMSNIHTQSWLIDRRHALRAMGTCISLPMLECMIPLRAAEQSFRDSSAQRLHLPRQRRPFAELSDHDAGQGLPVFPVA